MIGSGRHYAFGLLSILALLFTLVAGAAMAAEEAKADEKSPAAESGYDKLGATVTYLKFFESDFTPPPVKERVFRTSFNVDGIRFLNWQVGLKYPKPGKKVSFTINAKCFDSNGETIFEQDMPAHVKPGWSKSRHNMGWGHNVTRRSWAAGRYKLVLSVDDSPIAVGYFQVVSDSPAEDTKSPKDGFGGLGATVTALKFYESGKGVIPKPEREYRTSFDSSLVRYIYWEVDFKYPKPGRSVTFTITTNCYNEDETVKFSQLTKTTLQPGWSSSWVTKGWGSKTPGKAWPAGRYRLELEVDGAVIAKGYFTVQDK